MESRNSQNGSLNGEDSSRDEKVARVLKLIDHMLSQDISDLHKDIFFDLFFNRDYTIPTIATTLEESKRRGRNVLIIGANGVGKTNLIKRVVSSNFMQQSNFIIKFIDLIKLPFIRRNYIDYNAFYQYLTEMLLQYFESIKLPYAAYTDLDGTYSHKYQECLSYLNEVIGEREIVKGRLKSLAVFVDDIDFLEEEYRQEEVLDMLRPLFNSRFIVVIYAVRYPAFLAMRRSFLSKEVYRKSEPIKLIPLSLRGILIHRLALILRDNAKNKNNLLGPGEISVKALRRKRGYKKLKKELSGIIGDITVESLSQIYYPLTRRQENFIFHIANGNVRTMLEGTRILLNYIMKNMNKLEEGEEPGTYRIGRQGTIELFADEDIDERVRIIDLHEKMSEDDEEAEKDRNSLMQNILEAVNIYEDAHDDFYASLDSHGSGSP